MAKDTGSNSNIPRALSPFHPRRALGITLLVLAAGVVGAYFLLRWQYGQGPVCAGHAMQPGDICLHGRDADTYAQARSHLVNPSPVICGVLAVVLLALAVVSFVRGRTRQPSPELIADYERRLTRRRARIVATYGSDRTAQRDRLLARFDRQAADELEWARRGDR